MTRTHVLLLLLLLFAGGLGAFLWAFSGDSAAEDPGLPTGPARNGAGTAGGGTSFVVREDLPAADGAESEETRVVFPLEVMLDLVPGTERGKLAAPGVIPLGGGARAKIAGSLIGEGGKPIPGEVRFVAGTNEGRVLRCDAKGEFGANDLEPGIAIVQLTGPGVPGAMREVLLRNNSAAHLNVGFGRPASVYGKVVDTEGKGIDGARVLLDGQETWSDHLGEFHFPRVASGPRVLAFVDKPGYARFRQMVPITAGMTIPKDKVSFVLERGARLKVSIQERLGANAQAQLFLIPDVRARSERKFPWHEVNPTLVHPGGTVTIEDLPSGTLQLYLFHRGAKSQTRVTSVTLAPGGEEHAVLHLETTPKLVGKVTLDGEPVHKALVTLEAPHRAKASATALGQPLGFLEVDVLPTVPPAAQKAWSSPLGEFEFSAHEEISGIRYLTAVGPDKKTWAGRVVRRGDERVELELSEIPENDARLELDFPGRHLGLPVDTLVNEAPRGTIVLAPDESFVVDELIPGRWKLSLRWRNEWICQEQDIELGEREGLVFQLPKGAIQGQPPGAYPGR